MVWGVFGTDINDGQGTNYNKTMVAFELDCRSEEDINAQALHGTWSDREKDFYSGKPIQIKKDSTWVVAGHVKDGKIFCEDDSITACSDDLS